MAKDTYRQVLAAVALLEDKIERLNHSISCGQKWSGSQRWSGSCRQSCSHHQRRSRAVDQCSREPSVKRIQSLGLLHSRQWVTFEDSLSVRADESRPLSWADKMAWANCMDWSQPEVEDLGCPPMLDPGSRIPQWGGTFLGHQRAWGWPWSTGNAGTILSWQ